MNDFIENEQITPESAIENQPKKINYIRGETDVAIDDKLRITIPVNVRTLFEEEGFITRAFNMKSLIFYPMSYWNKIELWLGHQSFTDQKVQTLSRFLSSGNFVKLDNHNRISISRSLCDYAGLEKTVTVIGVGSAVEIWDKSRLKIHNENLENSNIIDDALTSINTTAGEFPAPGFY